MKRKIPYPALCLTAALSLAMLCGCGAVHSLASDGDYLTLKSEETTQFQQVFDDNIIAVSYSLTTYDYSNNTATRIYADNNHAVEENELERELISFMTDSAGRIISKKHSNGFLEKYTYSDKGGYGYYNLIHLTSTNSNYSDHLIDITYNEDGFFTHGIYHIQDYDSYNEFEAECSYEYLEYDSLAPTYVLRTSSDGEITYIECSYDSLGNRTSVVFTNEAGEEVGKVLYTYGSHGGCIHEETYSLGTDGLYLSEDTYREYN